MGTICPHPSGAAFTATGIYFANWKTLLCVILIPSLSVEAAHAANEGFLLFLSHLLTLITS
jgi:hypothetical protein